MCVGLVSFLYKQSFGGLSNAQFSHAVYVIMAHISCRNAHRGTARPSCRKAHRGVACPSSLCGRKRIGWDRRVIAQPFFLREDSRMDMLGHYTSISQSKQGVVPIASSSRSKIMTILEKGLYLLASSSTGPWMFGRSPKSNLSLLGGMITAKTLQADPISSP